MFLLVSYLFLFLASPEDLSLFSQSVIVFEPLVEDPCILGSDHHGVRHLFLLCLLNGLDSSCLVDLLLHLVLPFHHVVVDMLHLIVSHLPSLELTRTDRFGS